MTPPESHADLLKQPLFGHLATVRPDGSPQSSVMWFDWDGEVLRFTHTRTRQKFRNFTAEPRIAMSVVDPADEYRSLEVRGRVEAIEEDSDGEFYRRTARRYSTDDRVPDAAVRVVIVVRPTSFIAVTGGHVVEQ